MSDEHTHAWLDEREPEDRPSLWDERDLDVEYNPEPPEDREWVDTEEPVYIHRQAGGVGWSELARLWDGIQERER